MKRRAIACFGLSLLLSAVLAPSIVLGSDDGVEKNDLSASGDGSNTALDTCISRQRKLDALFLIDESASLKKNDSLDQRVPALKAAMRALNSLTRGEVESAVDVEVAIAGFGTRFTERKSWGSLDDDSLTEFLTEIDRQAEVDRKSDQTTRYHEALKGAIRTFEDRQSDGTRCRLLVWFSDGEHDDSNTKELTESEQRQISRTICGADGLADGLRRAQVFTQAIGLNSSVERMGLMKLIAEGEGTFRDKNFAIDSCGDLPPSGVFGNAEKSGEIVDVITVPGGPKDVVKAQPCKAAVANCAEMRFTADDSVVSFKAHITIPDLGVDSALFETGDGVSVDLLKSSFDTRPDSLVIERLTEEKVLIEARRVNGQSLAGEWVISFSGPRALEATGKVKFLGDAKIDILDKAGKPASKIDRFKTESLTLKIANQGGAEMVGNVKAAIRGLSKQVPLKVVSIDDGTFSIEASELNEAVNEKGLKESSAAELEVLPVGIVSGLVGAGGKPVPIDFKVTRSKLGLTNGAQFPQYIPEEAGGVVPAFKGRERGIVTLRFKGPDAGNGEVLLATEPNPEHDFRVVGDSYVCNVPQQAETVCQISLKPGKDGYGEVEFPISATYSSDVTDKTAKEVIPVGVSMTREPNVGKGVRNAVLLILGFIVVQLLIRAAFAALVSKFGRLQPTAKKAVVKIRVARDGTVLGERTNQLSVTDSDHTYAFEFADSQRQVDVGGFHLATSPMQTFLHSTTSPVGYVSMPNSFVFGSNGVRRSKKDPKVETLGQVDLALRKQWAIGISSGNVAQLAGGADSVDAVLFALLDPLEQTPLESQLGDLEFAISGSTFAADLAAAIDGFAAADVEESNSDSDLVHQSAVSSDPFVNDHDPFVTAASSTAASPVEDSKPRRRRKKDRANGGGEEPSAPPPADPFDPFA